MPEPILVLVGLAVAAAFVLVPLWRDRSLPPDGDADPNEAAEIRHRAALEALRDVEADRRAGSLDDGGYAAARAEAEARAVQTRAELDASTPTDSGRRTDAPARRWAALAAAVIGIGIVAGTLVPATGLANEVVDTRRERIAQLTDALVADPTNPDTLLALADAYLAGSSRDDLVAAVRVLQILLQVEPEHAGAYERVVAAYIRAADWSNARAALDDYAGIDGADPVEIAFLDGLVARGSGDTDAAITAFDRFLELAPDDPRAPMVRGLREDAAAGR